MRWAGSGPPGRTRRPGRRGRARIHRPPARPAARPAVRLLGALHLVAMDGVGQRVPLRLQLPGRPAGLGQRGLRPLAVRGRLFPSLGRRPPVTAPARAERRRPVTATEVATAAPAARRTAAACARSPAFPFLPGRAAQPVRYSGRCPRPLFGRPQRQPGFDLGRLASPARSIRPSRISVSTSSGASSEFGRGQSGLEIGDRKPVLLESSLRGLPLAIKPVRLGVGRTQCLTEPAELLGYGREPGVGFVQGGQGRATLFGSALRGRTSRRTALPRGPAIRPVTAASAVSASSTAAWISRTDCLPGASAESPARTEQIAAPGDRSDRRQRIDRPRRDREIADHGDAVERRRQPPSAARPAPGRGRDAQVAPSGSAPQPSDPTSSPAPPIRTPARPPSLSRNSVSALTASGGEETATASAAGPRAAATAPSKPGSTSSSDGHRTQQTG